MAFPIRGSVVQWEPGPEPGLLPFGINSTASLAPS